jgi:hypothetical protein
MTVKELIERIQDLPDDTPVFFKDTDREGYSGIRELQLTMAPVKKFQIRWRLAGRDEKPERTALCFGSGDRIWGHD